MHYVVEGVSRVYRWMILLPLAAECTSISLVEAQIQELILSRFQELHAKGERFPNISFRVEHGTTRQAPNDPAIGCLKLIVSGFQARALRNMDTGRMHYDKIQGDDEAYAEFDFQPTEVDEVNELATFLISRLNPTRGYCDVCYAYKTWIVKAHSGVATPQPFPI